MKRVSLPGGETVPALGQGTWRMGDGDRVSEIAALRVGIELGMTLIDTAEIYGDGASESLVGAAVAGWRDAVFIVSKAHPRNASRDRLPRACEASLGRLNTDRIDLYLLHWRGGTPLAETAEAMRTLRDAGKIRHWGVSNLDVHDMEEIDGQGCAADQILYNLSRRGPEHDLLPWLAGRGVAAMAYSPVEQGRLLGHRGLGEVAASHGATPAQVALAWSMARVGVISIPKAASLAHVRENAAAARLQLTDDDHARLDKAFPPPRHKLALETI